MKPLTKLVCVVCVAIVLPAVSGLAESPRPNIVVIISDDLGYGDLGCFGGSIPTPHLDRMASRGIRFTQAYVSGPICAPTRAGLMTGRYQARFGYETLTGFISRQIEDDYGVDTDEVLLPEIMRDAGYRTAVIGKWHLGYNEKYRPNRRGVDHFFGFLPGGHDYFVWDQVPTGPQGGPIFRNNRPVEGEGYLTEAFTDEAVRFIHEEHDRPFFLYLSYFNVHTPLQVPEEYLIDGDDSRLGKLRAMVRALDTGVGDVVKAVRDAGLERDTLVVFLNDNGSPFEPSNKPLSGVKFSLKEGGIRVPMIFSWPGTLDQGVTYDRPIIQLDLLPTFAALGAADLPADREIDGVNIMPYLRGEKKGDLHDALYWRFGASAAIRSGDWKLYRDREGKESLVNLSNDVSEQHDVLNGHPRIVADLRKLWMRWDAMMQ